MACKEVETRFGFDKYWFRKSRYFCWILVFLPIFSGSNFPVSFLFTITNAQMKYQNSLLHMIFYNPHHKISKLYLNRSRLFFWFFSFFSFGFFQNSRTVWNLLISSESTSLNSLSEYSLSTEVFAVSSALISWINSMGRKLGILFGNIFFSCEVGHIRLK